MANTAAEPPMDKPASASEVFESLGDHELAAIHALYRYDEGLDQVGLASEARLGLTDATATAQKLAGLGLVEVSDEHGRTRFRLIRERLREQVKEAPSALFS